MKILLPVHHFPPRYSAGAEVITVQLASWLMQRGHAVEVVCIEAIDAGRPNELSATLDEYYGIPVHRLSFDLLGALERDRWSFDNPLLGEWFVAYFRNNQVDLAHFQAGYLLGAAPIRAATAAGVPAVLTLHDYWFLCPQITLQRGDGSVCRQIPDDPAGCAWCQRLRGRRYRIPERLTAGLLGGAVRKVGLHNATAIIAERRQCLQEALTLPEIIIAPSQFLAKRFAPFVPRERMQVVPVGLDLERYNTYARRPTDGVLRIGFVGQIAPHKGIHLLVSAFRRLKTRGQPLELHIYGGLQVFPKYVETLRRLAGDDTRIHFLGRFENHRSHEVLSGIDVLVVPSTWYENRPMAILEAQASGTPVITAALGGMAEMVRDEVDGLHFLPDSVGDLERQLQRVLDEPELLPRLRAGISPPRNREDEMQQLMDIYAALVQRSVVP